MKPNICGGGERGGPGAGGAARGQRAWRGVRVSGGVRGGAGGGGAWAGPVGGAPGAYRRVYFAPLDLSIFGSGSGGLQRGAQGLQGGGLLRAFVLFKRNPCVNMGATLVA